MTRYICKKCGGKKDLYYKRLYKPKEVFRAACLICPTCKSITMIKYVDGDNGTRPGK